MKYPLHVLSVSQYGSGLSQVGTQFSGALDRQKDYVEYVEKYTVIVPSETGSEEPVRHGENLVIYPVVSRGVLDFCLRAYKKAVELHKERTFDVHMVDNPHVMGPLGILLKWRLGTLFVPHTMADMIANPWYKAERLSNYIKAMSARVTVFFADMVRVSTRAEVERLEQKGIGRGKIRQVPFYIDIETFKERMEFVEAETDPNLLLFVGRLGPQKDIEVLMRAMAEVHTTNPDATLLLVGDGPQRKELEALSRTLGAGSYITFVGKVAYDEVPGYFKKAAAFVISSLYEGTCMVLLEAAVAKKPLVSTDFAGAKDFIRDGVEGYLSPVRDVHVLARNIRRILDDPKKTREMGENAFQRLDAFTRERALEKWDALCADITSRLK